MDINKNFRLPECEYIPPSKGDSVVIFAANHFAYSTCIRQWQSFLQWEIQINITLGKIKKADELS